jgi:hypothetical protein
MLEVAATIFAGIIIVSGLTILAAVAIVFISGLETEEDFDD